MKYTKRTITSIAALFLTAVTMASTAAPVSAVTVPEVNNKGGILSDDLRSKEPVKPGEWRYDPETGIHGDYDYWRRKKIRQDNQWKYDYYNKVKGTKKKISILNYGFFHAKNVKFYGRKCLGIDDNDGSWILGKWEQLNTDTSVHGATGYNFDISGEYMCFAFSYDITWGTDFPYSGVFLDQNSKYFAKDWKKLEIAMWGAVRTGCITIDVDDSTIVHETNCGSHSEWKP